MLVHINADLVTGLQDNASSDGPSAEVGGWLIGLLEEQTILSSFAALLPPGRLATEEVIADLGARMLVWHLLEQAAL